MLKSILGENENKVVGGKSGNIVIEKEKYVNYLKRERIKLIIHNIIYFYVNIKCFS